MADTPVSGTVNIPKIGRVKKVYVYGGVAVVGVLAVVYYRQHKAAALSGSSAPADGQQTDPAGNVGVIDPATGYVEGSPEDLSALSSQADFNPGTDLSGSGSTGPSIDTQVTNGPPFTNNAAWTTYVLANLPQAQDNPSGVAATLGAYLAGAQVQPDQVDVIHAADALAGPPPVAGHNGMPPSINVAGSASGVTPPDGGTIHQGAPPHQIPDTPAGTTGPSLTHSNITATSVDLQWSSWPNAVAYHVYRGQPVTGQNTHVGTVGASGRSYHVSGLHPGTEYEFFVQPWGSNGRALATSALAIIKTRS